MEVFSFGENLRIVRQAKGISQEVVAPGLNMAQSTYSKIERDPKISEPEMVEKIAKVLEIMPSILLSGRDITDLIPKNGFEQKAKEILTTRVGMIFYWILVIPFINAAYDMGDSFCAGYGTNDEVRKVVRFVAGLAAVIFAYYWRSRIQKGKE